MLYPVYVHRGDDTHAHGVTFPDFPGCFTAADDEKDLRAAILEAVEAHFDGGRTQLPAPSAFEDLFRDPQYQGGYWMMVNIDLTW